MKDDFILNESCTMPDHDNGKVDQSHPLWREYQRIVRNFRAQLIQAPTFDEFLFLRERDLI